MPGMVQWQTYARNSTTGAYTHQLGYFSKGHDAVAALENTTMEACKSTCDKLKCGGISFEDSEAAPTHELRLCYVKNASCHFQPADLSFSNHCKGTSTPSDCPYNLYRTSVCLFLTPVRLGLQQSVLSAAV